MIYNVREFKDVVRKEWKDGQKTRRRPTILTKDVVKKAWKDGKKNKEKACDTRTEEKAYSTEKNA